MNEPKTIKELETYLRFFTIKHNEEIENFYEDLYYENIDILFLNSFINLNYNWNDEK